MKARRKTSASGRFVLRLTPELHAELQAAAKQSGVSLNEFCARKLSAPVGELQLGPAAALAGSALWLSFLLAGLVAALTAYSYARLGAIRPKASPEFQYTALAFGDDVGFIAGWLMLVGDIAAAASVALGFGGYLGHLLGTPTDLGAALKSRDGADWPLLDQCRKSFSDRQISL